MSREPVQIARDPFARSSLMRAVEPDKSRRCKWCGGPGRFRYWHESDTARPALMRDDGLRFCGVADWRAYYA
jgi:hypothetical protein